MAGVTFNGNVKSTPTWVGDFGGREHVMPFPAKLDAAQFKAGGPFKVQINHAAGYAVDATSLTVDALPEKIAAGTILHFGEKQWAIVTEAAAKAATTIKVEKLPTALVDNDYAYYGGDEGQVYIPSGTLVGRTLVERDAGTGFGPADSVNDEEIFLIYFEIPDASKNNDVELYRPGSLVYENYLPNWTGWTAGDKAKVRALYQCITMYD